jgi:hypothetical protein
MDFWSPRTSMKSPELVIVWRSKIFMIRIMSTHESNLRMKVGYGIIQSPKYHLRQTPPEPINPLSHYEQNVEALTLFLHHRAVDMSVLRPDIEANPTRSTPKIHVPESFRNDD